MKPLFANAEENFAAHFLRLIGLTVLSRNDRRYGAELDLLVSEQAGDEIYVFEVKRRAAAGVHSFPVISARQRSRLKKVALSMQQAAGKFLTIRICLLLVDVRRGSAELLMDI